MSGLRSESVESSFEKTQVFTPPELASFMVSMLNLSAWKSVDLLEPAAGAGALAERVVDASEFPPIVTLVERDETLGVHLQEFLHEHQLDVDDDSEVFVENFFDLAPKWIREGRRFTHIVMNPPYGRISPKSSTAEILRSEKVRAHNLFAAFLWLGADLLVDGGQLVAVVPRSFLTGVQYAATRAHLFERASLHALHHFTDRRGVFARDAVQQEVVVLGITRAIANDYVRYSQSATMAGDIVPQRVRAERILLDKKERYCVLVPSLRAGEVVPNLTSAPLLPEGVDVAVGNVVDFRVGADLVDRTEADVPLIGAEAFYSKPHKLRGLKLSSNTERHVYPPGRYVIIRRISPAESTPRIQAKLIEATGQPYHQGVAFENHILVLHSSGGGLSGTQCTVVLDRLVDVLTEQQFNERGGTTQVNAGDIRALKYSS